MKSYLKKLLVFVMAVFIIIGMFAGCGSKATETKDDSTAVNKVAETSKDASQVNTAENTSGNKLQITDKPITLKFFVPWFGDTNKVMNNLSEHEVVQELEKRTNIHFEFIHPIKGQEKEQITLLISSGDYPDLIKDKFDTYKGGPDGAVKDGILINMNELIEKYAPNYLKLVDSIPGYDKIVKSDSGMYVWFMSAYSPEQFINKPFSGLIIRQDWLDESGLSMPETIEDWYTVLKAFKEKKNCEAPLGLAEIFTETASKRAQMFVGSYDTAYTFYQQEGKVKYGPIQPQFKDFLSTFSKWYSEGLIDKDMATHSVGKNIYPMMADGRCGAMIIHPYEIKRVIDLNQGKDAKFKLAAAPYPSLKEGEKCKYRHNNLGVGGEAPVFITSKCKYPVEAIKFFDYIYSEEGHNLVTWGVEEGRTYNIVNGKHEFTDLVTKNPDGLTYSMARCKYSLPNLADRWDWELEESNYALPEQKDSTWGTWLNSATADNVIPDLVTMTADEKTEFTGIMAQVEPYTQEMVLKFIMGLEPLSNYDKFVEKVKSMKIDKAEAIQQAALDRFSKR